MPRVHSDRNTPSPVAPPRTAMLLSGWGIFLLALTLRLAYLGQIRGVPFLRTLVGDAASYDAWARRIAAGDWLGTEAFYQAPAYPYFLALVYRLLGDGPYALRVVQAFLGATSCVMLARAGRAFFNPAVGIVAGLMLALYPPAIFFGGLIQKTALDSPLMAGLLWALGVHRLQPRASLATLSGLLLAALALTRENALIVAPVIAIWLLLGFPQSSRSRRLGATVLFAAGLALPLGLVAWRNHRVGSVWAVTTTQAGPNFWIGNNPAATGRYEPLVPGRETPLYERGDAHRLAEAAVGRPLSDGEVSRYWLGRAWEFIRSEPGRWVGLLGRKTLLAVNAYEISDTEGFVVYRAYSTLLDALAIVWHFGAVAPLAAAGIAFTWSRRRELGLLHAINVALLASIAAFYVLARYRFPLVPLLILFAAAGATEAWTRWGQRDARNVKSAALALVAAAIVCNLPMSPTAELDAAAYGNLAAVLADRGDLAAAGNVFDLAIETSPQSATLRYNRAVVHRLAGQPREALLRLHEARGIQPALPQVSREMGAAFEALGDRAAAHRCYVAAAAEDPHDTEAAAGAARTAD